MQAQQLLVAGVEDWRQGRTETAQANFAQAALRDPRLASAHGNLGVALRRAGKLEAAIASYRRAIALSPHDPDMNSSLGNALREWGDLEAAERHLRIAFAAAPRSAGIIYNLALLLRDRRKHDEAAQLFQALCRADPDSADYAWDLALTDLYRRDYRSGFAGYDARRGLARAQWRDLPGEQWRPGQDVAGKTVLVMSEQGFGDALQYARFFPLVAARGARLVVEAPVELAALFAAMAGPTQVVARGQALPAYDLWAPVMSLPHLLGMTWENLPAVVPYLMPPAAMTVEHPPGATLKVGLIWAGKTRPRDRSWPLEKLLPLMEDPRLAFWSLQVGERSADLEAIGADQLIRDLAPSLTSFADTAAAMAAMDVIVTIDTSAAHLAGALARPTCVLLRYVSDWRWLDEPVTSRWYPSLRLFRQDDPRDFDGPVARLKGYLATWLDTGRH